MQCAREFSMRRRCAQAAEALVTTSKQRRRRRFLLHRARMFGDLASCGLLRQELVPPPPGLDFTRHPALDLQTLTYCEEHTTTDVPCPWQAPRTTACAEEEWHTIRYAPSCISLEPPSLMARTPDAGQSPGCILSPNRSAEAPTAESLPSAARQDVLQVGTSVLVYGLETEAGRASNLQYGTVVRQLDQSSGRLSVRISNNSKLISVRRQNLLFIADSRAAGTNVLGETMESQRLVQVFWDLPEQRIGPLDVLTWCPLAQPILLLQQRFGPMHFELSGKKLLLTDSPGTLGVTSGTFTVRGYNQR